MLHISHFLWLFLLISSNRATSNAEEDDGSQRNQHHDRFISLGAIVDDNSRAGKEEEVAMKMAVVDFFGHGRHRPTVLLHVKNSHGDPLQTASSAKTLIKKHHARVILGMGTWQETAIVAELANKSKVPLLSLANEVPTGACSHWPFLVNAARSQFAQMKAIAAIIQSWGWRKVNVIYEDPITNPSLTAGITPYLIKALQEVGSVINDLAPFSLFDRSISENLMKLKDGQCRVFIVHTSTTLAAKIFKEAKKLDMMEKDFVWITTNSITDVLHTLNATTFSSMQGVLGVKSYFSDSNKQFKHFRFRFRKEFRKQFPKETNPKPGIHALQAYDAVRAVALAVAGNNSDRQNLLKGILKSNFEGLTGPFNFKQGLMLAPAHVYRIVNVIGVETYIDLGYWTEGLGFSVSISRDSVYKKSMEFLGQVLWPGRLWSVPGGWEEAKSSTSSQSQASLKIGIPTGNTHVEFVNVRNNSDDSLNVTGFAIEVFKATVKHLRHFPPYEFVAVSGTYDSLVDKLRIQKIDAVVADMAIISNRSQYAEFSQPYTEPGLQLVVYNKPRRPNRAWLFKQPFTSGMWAATGAMVLFNGFVVWLIERKHNPEFTRGTKLDQLGTMVSLSFTTLFSLQAEKLHSNLSRMTMVVWLFVALVITQSYTASLTSLLTIQRLDPSIVDVETLKRSGAKVGCDGDSFVVKYLETIGFNPHNIIKKYSEDDYPEALISGSIAAAFLEVPYVKVFLAKQCHHNFTTGEMIKVGGFGFVFPKNSPYLPDISRAILQVSENGKLQKLEKSMISSSNKCPSDHPGNPEEDHDSLELTSFQGLFLITVGTSVTALLLFGVRRGRKHWCCNSRVQPEPPNSTSSTTSGDHENRWDCHLPNIGEEPLLPVSYHHHAHDQHDYWLSAWEREENQSRWLHQCYVIIFLLYSFVNKTPINY
ncbi:hypothetical protein Ddye_004407 [Dipteronia dyeriana]|uniref:Glutamate receptor n=1 Tax=Dipteronia dyeriana TaxID=168575 RepID=A0AAE0CXD2_9ROSI|nr:hypothetical protein Ddye_004407 [Dipteronia dyeriana]